MMQGLWLDAQGRAPQPTLALFRPSKRLRAAIKLWSLDAPTTGLDGAVRLSAAKASHIPGAPQCWVHLCLYGMWKGHSAGEFEFSREVFDQLISNFDALSNPVPWTIGHPDSSTPAPGYVLQLAIKGDGTGEHDGLYALTEWTAKTADEIREGGWRFCSVYVDFESIDRKTNEPIGCELIQVGLTNNPFLDGQKPITLSRLVGAQERQMTPHQILHAFAFHVGLLKGLKLDSLADMEKEVAAAAKLFGMPKGTSIDKLIERLTAMQGYMKSLGGGTPDGGDAPADAGAAMSSKDAAKYAAAWKRLGSVKLDGPDAPPPDTTGEASDEEAQEGALLDTLMAILAKAGLDATSGKAALDQNADAIASLLTGGGTPVQADATMPAPMARKFAALETQLKAAQARDAELSERVAAFEKEKAEHAAKLAADAKLAEEKAAQEAKLAAEKKVADEKADADADIKRAIGDGRLLLKAGKEEGSEVEHARKLFAADHAAAKAWLASKPRIVPVEAITQAAHPTPPPIPPKADEISLAAKDLRDDTERQIVRTWAGKPRELVRNAIALHRQALADNAS